MEHKKDCPENQRAEGCCKCSPCGKDDCSAMKAFGEKIKVEVTTLADLATQVMSTQVFDHCNVLVQGMNLNLDTLDYFVLLTSLSVVGAQAAAMAVQTQKAMEALIQRDIKTLVLGNKLSAQQKEGMELYLKRAHQGIELIKKCHDVNLSRTEMDKLVAAYVDLAREDAKTQVKYDDSPELSSN